MMCMRQWERTWYGHRHCQSWEMKIPFWFVLVCFLQVFLEHDVKEVTVTMSVSQDYPKASKCSIMYSIQIKSSTPRSKQSSLRL
jgi:hypothetical protein